MELMDKGTVKGNYDGQDVDYDSYLLMERTGLSTKEYTLIVDFKNKEIVGDIIAYGGFSKLDYEDCLELAKKIEEPIRDFSHMI